MAMQDGRNATRPYRVRVGGTWYWVDPMARGAIEPGDTVVIYPVQGEAALAILRSAAGGETITFTSLEGERFTLPARDIVLHLAAVDDEQG